MYKSLLQLYKTAAVEQDIQTELSHSLTINQEAASHILAGINVQVIGDLKQVWGFSSMELGGIYIWVDLLQFSLQP